MIEMLVDILSGIGGAIALLCFILLGIFVLLIAVLGIYAVGSLLWDLVRK
jgi:hypothetical protein